MAALLWGALRWAVDTERTALVPTFVGETLIFLYAVTLLIFIYLYRGRKREHFLPLFLLTLAVKMIAAIVFAVWMVLAEPANAAANLSLFLIVYIVFTALEIGFLYPLVRRNGVP